MEFALKRLPSQLQSVTRLIRPLAAVHLLSIYTILTWCTGTCVKRVANIAKAMQYRRPKVLGENVTFR